MSNRSLNNLHDLIVDAWRTLVHYEQMPPENFRPAAEHGAANLHEALKLIEKKTGGPK